MTTPTLKVVEIMTDLNQRSSLGRVVINPPKRMAPLQVHTVGQITICCGRAFLSQLSYQNHRAEQRTHKGELWNQILTKKTPITKSDTPGKIVQCRHTKVEKPESKKHEKKKHENISHSLVDSDSKSKLELTFSFQNDRTGKFYTCRICGKIIKGGKTNYEGHFRIHSGQKPLKCQICPSKFFRFSSNLRRHMKTVHLTGQYKCPHCSYRMPTTRALTAHISLSHKPLSKKSIHDSTKNSDKQTVQPVSNEPRREVQIHKKQFTCKICGKIFTRADTLRHHVLTHSNNKPIKCDICNITFKNSGTKWKHNLTSHENNGTFYCEHCPCRFETSRGCQTHNVRYHGLTSSKSKKFQAKSGIPLSIKAAGRFTRRNLNSKNDEIDNANPVENVDEDVMCKVCGKQFSSPQAVRYHMSIHTGEKKHICNLCNLSFRLYGTLYQHWKSLHVIDGVVKCPYCSCCSNLEKTINQHISKYHKEEQQQED